MLSPLARLLHLRGKLRPGPFVPKGVVYFQGASLWNPVPHATREMRVFWSEVGGGLDKMVAATWLYRGRRFTVSTKVNSRRSRELLQPERQTDIHAAGEDREPTDHPDDRERPGVRPGHDENAEGNRHQAA